MERLHLFNHQAPGDILMFTAAVRDLHKAYPGQYQTSVGGSCTCIWQNNPFVTLKANGRRIKMQYPAIQCVGERHDFHFIRAFGEFLAGKIGRPIPHTNNWADIYFTETELFRPETLLRNVFPDRPYWLMLSGGKRDFTAKWWDPAKWQAVVDKLNKLGITVVQVGLKSKKVPGHHVHPPLTGVVNLVGKTPDFRDLMRLVLHASGVMCVVTASMHLAAACGVPCVVVSGGREPPWWEKYEGHVFLETMGRFPCCTNDGCWKNHVKKSGCPADKLCSRPVLTGTIPQPECLSVISPDDVVNGVLKYRSGEISPVRIAAWIEGQEYVRKRLQTGKEVVSMAVPSSPNDYSTIRQSLEQMRSKLKDVTKLANELQTDINALVARAEAPSPAQPRTQPAPAAKPQAPKAKAAPKVKAAPSISGELTELTACVLLFGPDANQVIKIKKGPNITMHQMHRRCLDSLLANTPGKALKKVIVGCNNLSKQSYDYAQHVLANAKVPFELVTEDPDKGPYKYPTMRRMLPRVETKWMLWLDDDSWFTQPWFEAAQKMVAANYCKGAVCYGKRYFQWIKADRQKWIRSRPWYAGVPYKINPAKHSWKVEFMTGGFWFCDIDVLRELNWPDPEIIHNGGDVMLGAALWQWSEGKCDPMKQCYRAVANNKQKMFVKISDADRRGPSSKDVSV